MTSLRRGVEYLWKAEGNRSDDFVEETSEVKNAGSRRDRTMSRSFACAARSVCVFSLLTRLRKLLAIADIGYDSVRFGVPPHARAARNDNI